MKLTYLMISIVIGLSICGSFAQLISTTETPSQAVFDLRNTSNRIDPTQTSNTTIANALKEGDALHVLVANNGTTARNLANWRLVTDNRNLTFTFPVFTLMPNTMVTIHTHKGNNTASDLYGSNFMWNGTSEIKLIDNNGLLVYDYRLGASSTK